MSSSRKRRSSGPRVGLGEGVLREIRTRLPQRRCTWWGCCCGCACFGGLAQSCSDGLSKRRRISERTPPRRHAKRQKWKRGERVYVLQTHTHDGRAWIWGKERSAFAFLRRIWGLRTLTRFHCTFRMASCTCSTSRFCEAQGTGPHTRSQALSAVRTPQHSTGSRDGETRWAKTPPDTIWSCTCLWHSGAAEAIWFAQGNAESFCEASADCRVCEPWGRSARRAWGGPAAEEDGSSVCSSFKRGTSRPLRVEKKTERRVIFYRLHYKIADTFCGAARVAVASALLALTLCRHRSRGRSREQERPFPLAVPPALTHGTRESVLSRQRLRRNGQKSHTTGNRDDSASQPSERPTSPGSIQSQRRGRKMALRLQYLQVQ